MRPLARVTLVTLAAAVGLVAAVALGFALAAARVPEHRAALESLVRAETGLDVRFSELELRWGWYGPEAVFHDVELREPGERALLLSAPKLVAGVELWRMLRTGEPGIGRITLVNPDIDLTRSLAPEASPAHGVAGVGAEPRDPGRLLARWRGTRIDVEGGTVRAAPAGVPLAAGIRRLLLRRAGDEWRAEALLILPESLGAALHAVASLRAPAQERGALEGSVTLNGSRLVFAGWHALLAAAPGAACLPAAGGGNATVRIELAHGVLTRLAGSVDGAGIAWPGAGAPAADLALERLHADWELTPRGADWHFTVAPRASVQLRLAGLELGAAVREAAFDWSAARPPAERLRAEAELQDLSIVAPGGTHTLTGLTAHLRGSASRLMAEVHAANARLALKAAPGIVRDGLAVHAQLELENRGRAWRLSTRALEIAEADARFGLTGTLTGADGGTPPHLDARATLSAVPVERLREWLGPAALAALGTDAAGLTGGRIEHAELVARGPLDRALPWSTAGHDFHGSLALSGATLAGNGDWPQLEGLDAHLDWHGARVALRVDGATSEGLRITAARGEWNAQDAALVSLTGRLEGPAQTALAWLRAHPQAAGGAAGIGDLGLTGETLVDFEVRRGASGPGTVPQYATRLTALLDGARLEPVAGLPGIEALRGTLALVDGHLQRSTVTGRWLGGPIALSLSERRDHRATVLAISGRGLLDVQAALLAAGGAASDDGALEGNAEWSADLRFLPAVNGEPASWRVRADSSLVGVASRLPEPFAKIAGSTLPLHLELLGNETAGELRVALGERLRGIAAVTRRGDLWQIARGAVNLGAAPPALPPGPEVRIEGRIERLDLAAYTALWRELTRSPAWPALSVELAATDLTAGPRSFANVQVVAHSGAGVDQLRLDGEDLDALVRFPTVVDAAHPITARLERLDLTQFDTAGIDTALAAALGPALQLSIADLKWQGHPLGALSATIASRGDGLEIRDVRLGGAGDEVHGTLDCRTGRCHTDFSLESHDAAATLERLGFRTDIAAAYAVVSGELSWPAAGSLASASGRLQVELLDGVTRGTASPPAPGAAPFGLLAVPGLVAGMGLPELPFARLTADFTLGEGQATTSNLHLDGDTEILLQGRVGLLAHDYDARVWVLKGEERLPAAVRGLGPGPRVAALWMSLRDFFGGAERERAAWRLRGTWDDPMVTQP